MIKFTFLKKREPKRFDYYPRYYDPDKEDLENRIARIHAELDLDKEDANIRREIKFRKSASENWMSTGFQRQARMANIRLIIILVAIILLFGVIYNNIEAFIDKLV